MISVINHDTHRADCPYLHSSGIPRSLSASRPLTSSTKGAFRPSLPPLPPHPGPLPRRRPLQNYVIPALPRHSGESRNPPSPFEAKGDASKRSEIAGVCGWGREAGWTQPITKVLQRSRRAGEGDSSIVGSGCELGAWFWFGRLLFCEGALRFLRGAWAVHERPLRGAALLLGWGGG